jgi:F-type H+-transporting ATPase subunit b
MAMKLRFSLLFAVVSTPALAASGPFFSLGNTNFVVLIAFIAFVGLLIYMKVPGRLTSMLDARAAQIKADLAEARALREEAKTILASYERKQAEVREQADRIVATAKDEAMAAAKQAKADLAKSIDRRLAAAQDQLGAAEKAALRDVRERAVSVAIGVAGEVLSKQMTADAAAGSIDAAISQVEARLN